MADEWFYANNGQPTGPVSTATLRELAAKGDLKPTDMVWQEGMSQWAPAGSTRGLFALAPSVPMPIHDPEPRAAAVPRPVRVSRRFEDDDDDLRDRQPIRARKPGGLSTGAKVAIFGGVAFVLFLMVVVGVAIVAIAADAKQRRPAAFQPPPPVIKGGQKQVMPPVNKVGVQQRGGDLPAGVRTYTINLQEDGDEHVQMISFKKGELVQITVTATKWAGGEEPDVDMYVEDPNGVEIAADDNPTKDCTVSFFAAQAGSYRVVVHLFAGSQVTATVRY